MLVSVKELKKYWEVNPKTLVHVGAHNAEELEAYTEAGWDKVIWIEVQPSRIEILREKLPKHHKLIEAAVWDKENISMNLNIMTNTESTSLLNLGSHAQEHPDVKLSRTLEVKTKTLELLLSEDDTPQMLALDIQGVELKALKGFGSRIKDVTWIYCEVNKKELYEDCCLIEDLDLYLRSFGFKRTITIWTEHGWGDALYTNTLNFRPKSTLKYFYTSRYWNLLNFLRESKQKLIKYRTLVKSRLHSAGKKT